jgi:hypothetical protein
MSCSYAPELSLMVDGFLDEFLGNKGALAASQGDASAVEGVDWAVRKPER